MQWKIIIRNIFRNPRRSLFAVSSVAVSVALMTFVGGLTRGMLDNLVTNSVRLQSGHLRLTTSGYAQRDEFLPVDDYITDSEKVLALMQNNGDFWQEVDVVVPRIVFRTILGNGNKTQVATALAGDTEVEGRISRFERSLVRGRYIGGPRETILGWDLAKRLNLDLGDRLQVVGQGADGSLRMRSFEVVGMFQTGQTILDRSHFQISLADARQMLRMDNGVQQILFMLKDYQKADALMRRMQPVLKTEGLLLQSWESSTDIGRLVRTMEGIYGSLYWLIALLGAIIISNIMTAIVLERRREIGLLKALGMDRSQIRKFFLAEGLTLGIVGSFFGMVVGLFINLVLSMTGLDFSASVGNLQLPLDPVVYPSLGVVGALKMMGIGVMVSGVVSWFPARKAADLEPVTALRSVF